MHENFVRGNYIPYDICLLRVKEPFTGPVSFARLPQMLVIVKGNHVIDPIFCTYKIESVKTIFFQMARNV